MVHKISVYYKKLLRLYPKNFRERFAESMEQTFNDLYNERKQQSKPVFIFTLWMFCETAVEITKEHILVIKQGEPMKNILTNQNSATILGFILMLPLILLFPIVVFEVQPFHGLLKPSFFEADGYTTTLFAKIVMIVVILLLPIAASFVTFIPIIRNVRAGNGILTHPGNLILALAIASFIILFLGGVIVDQYPCWIGVPNCD